MNHLNSQNTITIRNITYNVTEVLSANGTTHIGLTGPKGGEASLIVSSNGIELMKHARRNNPVVESLTESEIEVSS